MTSHKNRLAKLEAAKAPIRTPRLIVKHADGNYHERGQEITEAEYQAIVSDPANDVTLIVVEYYDEQPVSTYTDGNYSFTVGVDMGKI